MVATPVGERPGTETRVRSRRLMLSKLTWRVLAVNLIALIMLVAGMLYLSSYQERLIENEVEALRTEAQILAGALAEAAVIDSTDGPQALDTELARQMVRRVYEATETRTRLFAPDGKLVADSRIIGVPGGQIEGRPLPPPVEESWLRTTFDRVYNWFARLAGPRKQWPRYVERPEQSAEDYRSAQTALRGGLGRQIWTEGDGGSMILGVAVPVQRVRAVLGAVLVTRPSSNIDANIQSVREEILKVFMVALGVTTLLSLYLASTITRPIRVLARAAERLRHGDGRGRKLEIPDMTARHDEIGELSGALRAMTAAIWARVDAIERFAADVAHEIKNPLTSLRSAVETTARISDPVQQQRLMAIILEDVERLNRLITDISDASRLDAEMSRAESSPVDMGRVLISLVELYRATLEESGPKVALKLQQGGSLMVDGVEDRLIQVLRNLIVNAISFSPPDATLTLAAWRAGRTVIVTVEDEGPGIPPAKLTHIFDRFYSERPSGEKFGMHSGLGLSISKQIVTAHRGEIFAENREGRPGARFTIRLPAR
jgi:two-component system sensor histidine kinase ChvG